MSDFSSIFARVRIIENGQCELVLDDGQLLRVPASMLPEGASADDNVRIELSGIPLLGTPDADEMDPEESRRFLNMLIS